MKSINKVNTGPEAWPSDLLLMEYLLGSLPQDTHRAIDVWLAESPISSDRISDVAEAVLATAEATAHWQGSLGQVQKLPVSFRLTSRQRVGILSLAAALLVTIFSLGGFRTELRAENRIAIAWADALPGTDAELPEWILEPGFVDLVDLVGTAVSVDLLATDLGEADDLFDPRGAFGFSSKEPPEWLLAAVFSMGSEGFPADSGEVKQ